MNGGRRNKGSPHHLALYLWPLLVINTVNANKHGVLAVCQKLQHSFHLLFPTALPRVYKKTHFIDAEVEVQRGEETHPTTHSRKVAGPSLSPCVAQRPEGLRPYIPPTGTFFLITSCCPCNPRQAPSSPSISLCSHPLALACWLRQRPLNSTRLPPGICKGCSSYRGKYRQQPENSCSGWELLLTSQL